MKFNRVFEPGTINQLELENRLVVSAMSSHLGNDDGTPNEKVIRYLEAKAKGGWGLIFTEDLGVTEDAGSDPIVGSLWSDEQIPAVWAAAVQMAAAVLAAVVAVLPAAGPVQRAGERLRWKFPALRGRDFLPVLRAQVWPAGRFALFWL